LHADQIKGFLKNQLITFASTIFLPYVKFGLDNLTIASPDMGGSKERTPILNFLNQMVICYKQEKQLT
jgi:ribose-phosphate pyrophosphokinase